MSKLQNDDFKTLAQLTGAGGSASQLLNDTKIYLTANGLNKQLSAAITDGSIGGGGSTNLITDGNGEAGTTNYIEGSYSAATRPSGTFTPSSGAGAFAISTTSTNPLDGTNSFLLTKSSGASRQGRTVERTVSIASKYQGRTMEAFIDYRIVSGAFVAGSNGSSPTDSSLIFYIAQSPNGSTWTFTEPQNFKLLSNSTTLSDQYVGQFQVLSDTTQVKVIAYVSETANSAWVVECEWGLRPCNNIYAASNLDWKPITGVNIYGATNGLAFTNQTTTAFEKVIGDSVQYRIRTSWSGAPTTGTGKFEWSIPRTADSTKTNISTSSSIGHISYLDSGTAFKENAYPYLSTTSRISITSDGGVDRWDSTTPITWAAGDAIEIITDLIPCVGLSSSTQQSDGYDGRQIIAKVTGSQTLSNGSETLLDLTSVSFDKGGLVDISTDRLNIKSSGIHKLKIKVSVGAPAGATFNGYINCYKNGGGSPFETVDVKTFSTTGFSGVVYLNGFVDDDCVAGDYFQFKAFQQNGSSASASVTTMVTIEKPANPQTTSMGSKNVCCYQLAAGQTLTATGIIKFDTKLTDSFGSYNTSTGIFTAYEVGTFEISCELFSTTATSNWQISVRKNSSTTISRSQPLPIYNGGTSLVNNQSMNIIVPVQVDLNANETLEIFNVIGIGTGSINANALDNTLTIKKVK